MKKQLFIVLCICIWSSSDGQSYFKRNYEYGGINVMGSPVEKDSFYYVNGYDYNGNYSFKNISKVNLIGDTIKTLTFGVDSSNYGTATGKSALILNDKFYFIGGRVRNNISTPHICCVNDNLDSLWYKELMPYDSSVVSHIIYDGLGHFLLGGTIILSSLESQMMLMKTDTLGNIIWVQLYGGAGQEGAFSVDTTSDGNYILTGYTDSYGSGMRDVYIVKIDTAGNFLWQQFFGSNLNDAGWCKTLWDGNIAIFGGRYVSGKTEQDAFLKIIDNSGGQVFYEEYDYGFDLFNTNEHLVEDSTGFFFAGHARNGPMSTYDPLVYLLRTDKQGNKLFERTYTVSENDNYSTDIISQSDGGFVISGYCFPDGNTVLTQDGFLIKANCGGYFDPPFASFSLGSLDNYEVQLTNTSLYSLYSIIDWGDGSTDTLWYDDTTMNHIYADSGFYQVTLIASACGESDTIMKQVYASVVGIEPLENVEFDILVFPNPNSGNFEIIIEGLQNENDLYSLVITDVLGRIIFNSEISSNHIQLNMKDISPGIYNLLLRNEKKVLTSKKIIINR